MDADSFLYALAGIGLIFFGSKIFTHNLQSITGPFVRLVVNQRTDNLARVNLIGCVLSIFNQSSMGISYMILAYLNAGLMRLGQGIHMLLGAQLGLTTAAWFLNVGFDTRALFFLLFLGFIPAVIGQRSFAAQVSRCFFGLGLVLLGIEFSDKINLYLIPYLGKFTGMQFHEPGFYKMFLLTALASILLTGATRSKLLVVALSFALLKTFTFGPLFSLAIVLGLAVGGSIPQLIVGYGMSSATNRLALGYVVVETVSMIFILVGLGSIDQYFLQSDILLGGTGFAIIYSAYSLFVILLYSIGAKFVFHPLINVLVPQAKYKEAKRLLLKGDLGDISTALAIDLVEQELKKMSAMVEIQLDLSRANLLSKLGDKSIEKKVSKYEKIADNIHTEVGGLINQLMQRSLQKEEVFELRAFLTMTTELERLSNSADELINLAKELRKEDEEVPSEILKSLRDIGNHLQEFYIQSFTALMEGEKHPESHDRFKDKIFDDLKVFREEQREMYDKDLLSSALGQNLFDVHNCLRKILKQATRFGESVDARLSYLDEQS
ncbi:MAG: hypothetical protein CL674_06215 [Bdellovibrionaceae bacterium]|nr:hypothetical protein [Pseudobdellovibrionaceae bacterium]|tara:strand:- start:54922 stop:56571 length:1650 start_codon:yes stop_codon:yes gene_type:complete